MFGIIAWQMTKAIKIAVYFNDQVDLKPHIFCDFLFSPPFLITLCIYHHLLVSAHLVLSLPLLKSSHMLSSVRAGGKPQVDPTPPFGLASVPRTQIHVATGQTEWGVQEVHFDDQVV